MNPENDWAECLTTAELKKIWDKGSDVNNWNQVKSGFPDEEMKLFGAGTDSGTFDYFTEQINGEEGASRSDYSPSEDDNVTVQGVVRRQGQPRLLRPLLRARERGQGEDGPGRRRRRLRRADQRDGPGRQLQAAVAAAVHLPVEQGARRTRRRAEFVKFYVDNYDTIAEQAQFVPMTDEQAQKAKDDGQPSWQG